MAPGWDRGGGLLRGPLLQAAGSLPLVLRATLCDLRPRFLAKGRAGRGHRAVARNGRVLLVSPRPLADLEGWTAKLRLQVWHRTLLAGEAPEPYGLLLVLGPERVGATSPRHGTYLTPALEGPFVLALDLGGRLSLAFRLEDDGGLKSATNT